jgi:sulfide:quinone oxidoreductase
MAARRTGADEAFRIVIAGGGVAAVEALLGVHDLLKTGARTELIAPDPEFVLRPLLVAEPFGIGEAVRLDLAELAAANGAAFRRDALATVDASSRSIRTRAGERLHYDALLLAIGAHPIEAVSGAITFGGSEGCTQFRSLLDRLPAAGAARLAFAVPAGVKWTLAAYELALLTAAHLRAANADAVEISLVTHEAEPLGLFGPSAPCIVSELLESAGIALHLSRSPSAFADGRLEIERGDPIEADHVVALPSLEVPPLPGIPQRHDGFIPTDVRMNVEGLTRVWAAGDATWFPIKQGGLAAQQAQVASESIAVLGGAAVAVAPFRPVLRAALLTGSLPAYFRASMSPPGATSEASPRSLWWPAGKVAGRWLTPYLATRRDSPEPAKPLEDVAGAEAGGARSEDANDEAVRFALAAAEADAGSGDHAGALRWLDLAEELTAVLPSPWAERRRDWAGAAAGEASGAPPQQEVRR